MADVVGICNSALIKLGATPIVSLTEGTKKANLCNEQYAKIRDDELRGHEWNFNKAQAKLGQLSAAPTFEFDHAYQLPPDWVRTYAVHDNDAGIGTVVYRIKGRTILSSADDIYLTYGSEVDDPNEMTADFREMLAVALARDLAPAIPNSNTREQISEARLEKARRKARSTDAIEDYPPEFPQSSWITARGGGTNDWRR